MKIQLSPTRIVKDAMTVWHEEGPEVDLVMDIKRLTFADNSLDSIFCFHVLDRLYPTEILGTMQNWYSKLKPGTGSLFIVADDYEFITRSFVGGDLNIDMINNRFTHPTQFTQQSLIDSFLNAGFNVNDVVIWYTTDSTKDFNFEKQPHELVMSGDKK